MTIEQAFKRMSRKLFLPKALRVSAGADMPLPIGYGQTNSQPYTVRQMLRWLDVRVGQKVLDVGSGSGWTTALLSCLVGPKGKVFAVEVVPQLLDFGRTNCESAGVKNAKFYMAQKTFGLAKHRPYDRILVSASAPTLPPELIEQLKSDGKMVIPVKHDILEITKQASGKLKTKTHPGFSFVPLVSRND